MLFFLQVLTCLEESPFYFDEIAHAYTRVQKDSRTLLAELRSQGLSFPGLEQLAQLSIFTLEEAASIAGEARKALALVPPRAKTKAAAAEIEHLVLAASDLGDLAQQTNDEQELLQQRAASALACAAVAARRLTDKMNPLVRPLMDAVRAETNADMQRMASEHLVLLLRACASRTPNPVPKIFKNLLAALCNDEQTTPHIAKQEVTWHHLLKETLSK